MKQISHTSKLVVLPVLLSLVFAAPALAGHRHKTTKPLPDPTKLALSVAASYWRTSPEGSFAPACGGNINIVLSDPTQPGAEPGVAWAEAPCTIHLNPVYWFSKQWDEFNFRQYCQTITHEEGHLLLGDTYFAATDPTNPAHSPDPHNVMFWEGTEEDTPHACKVTAYVYAHVKEPKTKSEWSISG